MDYKGELARLTAEHRRKHLGQQIVLLDPFHVVTDKPATFNPLDLINKDDPFAIDQVNALANALVMRTGDEKEPHWNDAAEGTIAGVTANRHGSGASEPQSGRSSLQSPWERRFSSRHSAFSPSCRICLQSVRRAHAP